MLACFLLLKVLVICTPHIFLKFRPLQVSQVKTTTTKLFSHVYDAQHLEIQIKNAKPQHR